MNDFTNVDNQFLLHYNLQKNSNQRMQPCRVIDAVDKRYYKKTNVV